MFQEYFNLESAAV